VQLGANKAGLIKLIAGATIMAETDMRKEKKKVGGGHVRGEARHVHHRWPAGWR
jgi:hypothetical protein